jgi:NAD-dependent SIR2 family protein deacetylase
MARGVSGFDSGTMRWYSGYCDDCKDYSSDDNVTHPIKNTKIIKCEKCGKDIAGFFREQSYVSPHWLVL